MTEQTETKQSWHFTFGSGNTHPVTGVDLSGRYVTISGSYDDARAEMLARFGRGWCDQYEAYADGSAWIPEQMEELPRIEWPALPDVHAASLIEQARESADRAMAECEEPVESGYWSDLADDLIRIARRVRKLSGTPEPTDGFALKPTLDLVTTYADDNHEQMVPIVDRIATMFDTTAEVERDRAWPRHGMEARVGVVRVTASARIPDPETTEVERLRAELAALRAQVGGAR